MNKQISQIIVFAAIAGMALAVRGVDQAQIADSSDQLEFPVITRQPIDQAILLGSTATFTAQAINGKVAYQWYRNGVPLDGQTNSMLTLENITIEEVGYYSADVSNSEETVPTRSALLNVYTMSGGGPITVFGAPVVSSGSQGGCPGPYAGYVNYIKTVSQGWGWAPTAGTTQHVAADYGRADTKIEYVGKNGDRGCNQSIVTVPSPTLSPKYRFAIYFPNNVPTSPYPIFLSGFNP